MRLRSGALGALVLLTACGGREGGVRVLVRLSSFEPACVEVKVADEGGAEVRVSRVERRPGRTEIRVALVTTRARVVGLEVLSREGSCDGNIVERRRRAEPITLSPGRFADWEVALAASDLDGDGWAARTAEASGSDCDDANPAIFPGAPEVCAPGFDQDCDGLDFCADPDCALAACDDGSLCTQDDRCRQGGCAGLPVVCANPPSPECHSVPGYCTAQGVCEYPVTIGRSCPDGGACRSDGVCTLGEANCLDGQDNDGDNSTDCEDSDCYDQTCSDGNACTVGDRCPSTGGACRGQPVACPNPPGPCWQGAQGTCVAGTCVYSADTSRACNDGRYCTESDRCRADGGCEGTARACSAPPTPTACFSSPGVCSETAQRCEYTVRAGASCSDGQACTHTDQCTVTTAGAACVGTSYGCPPAGECFATGVCLGDGTCRPVVRAGQPCSSGICQPDGGCGTAAVPFPFTPSNFVPANFQVGGPVRVLCNIAFDTGSGTFVGDAGCVVGYPFPHLRGGVQVLTMESLVVEPNASLRLTGSAPAILAVYGDATINGSVGAYSRLGGVRGPGASAGCGARAGGSGVDGGQSWGGGGGGGQRTDGGLGGTGNGGAPGGTGGEALATQLPEPLAPGCEGGPGWPARNNGGPGGGAVQLSVAGTLTVASVVSASGSAGGGGPAPTWGGGGGGSGGTVVLEANTLRLTQGARVTANGGGGGQGGAPARNGNAGQDGRLTSSDVAPGGSGGGGSGASGGAGAAGASGPTFGASSSNGGGGGGGGAAGHIHLRAHGSCTVDGSAIVSPSAFKHNCP